jgi:hypothetical protein
MKIQPLNFLKRSFFYSRNGAVRISFDGEVDFDPFKYPELTKLGVWKIPPYMDDYYLFCTAREIPYKTIVKVLNQAGYKNYKIEKKNQLYTTKGFKKVN